MLKFLGTGILCGGLVTIGYLQKGVPVSIGDIALRLGFVNVLNTMGKSSDMLFCYIPLVIFHVLAGGSIYKHYCSGGFYYFSRCRNRFRWYIKETVMLYGMVNCFLAGMITGAILTSLAVSGMKPDFCIYEAAVYLFLTGLFLMETTLLMNLLSLLFGPHIGFAIPEAVCLLCMGLYLFSGDLLRQFGHAAFIESLCIRWNYAVQIHMGLILYDRIGIEYSGYLTETGMSVAQSFIYLLLVFMAVWFFGLALTGHKEILLVEERR